LAQPPANRRLGHVRSVASDALQTELLDRRYWSTRQQLRVAIFDFIEAFYNPSRRHSSIGYLSPTNYEKMTTATPAA
jgi:putative transposase